MKSLRLLTLGGLVAAVLAPCLSALELAAPFTDHAVLQRDAAVPVWGWDDQPGATVTVTFGGQTKTTQVNASGGWRADLDAMPARAEGADLVVTRGNLSVSLHDVVVGEVWIASGQSNMEWSMHNTRGYDDEKAKPANPLLRHLYVNHAGADLPAAKAGTGGWKVAAPDTLGGFTGVGYFFAQQLAEKLSVPVGLIHASWGGTAIESLDSRTGVAHLAGLDRSQCQVAGRIAGIPGKICGAARARSRLAKGAGGAQDLRQTRHDAMAAPRPWDPAPVSRRRAFSTA
ncbi:MAG: sialate O-acetylesterase [Lacunisphaera sp.]